jgi:SPP1 gp7 family putative phage head morphogenesis protein
MPKPLLTKAKKQWVGQFKPTALRGSPLNHNAAASEQYNKELQAMVLQMTSQVEREIKRFFEGETATEFFDEPSAIESPQVAQDASISAQARMLTNKITETFNSLFSRRAKMLAQRMIDTADKTSKSSLHGSLKALSGGLMIKTNIMPGALGEALNAATYENVQLIKTISEKYLAGIQGAVMRSIQPGGNGLADLVPYMQSHKEITQRHARNIALDQTRKAFNVCNSERMKALGIKKFEWIHSGGGLHPRVDHVKMDGNIYSFDDLPVIGVMYGSEVRGIPGQLPSCRCSMAPVIEFDDE